MRRCPSFKLIQYLALASRTKGFTLIELLVVMIILGVLFTFALPNLLNQIGKARETEAKTTLGVISRGQQAYHYEHGRFYDGAGFDNFVGFSTTSKYYRFTPNSSTDEDIALHTAYARDPSTDGTRDFAVGVYYNAPRYSQIICMADAVGNNGLSSTVTSPNNVNGNCIGGDQIQ